MSFWTTLAQYVKTASENEMLLYSLVIVGIVLLFNNWRISKVYKERLEDKNQHIEDLVGQRNAFQKKLLDMIGIKRETTNEED